ncbi:hypothetical protein [Kitasatospora sp. HPMI-4]|uniref:hypothetical protein n=1 Tax=Kitasatospora sp. HPMI-4 TaxID=3448443 RepID=UPI003F1A5EEB
MTRDKLDRLADLRAACTLEKHAEARRQLTLLGPTPWPVPTAADPDQERLERWILHRCAWPNGITAYPFGFQHVTPEPDHLTIHVESNPEHVRELVKELLPNEYEGDLGGVPGLRAGRDNTGAPLLYLAGTRASVTLRGIAAKDWQVAVTGWRSHLASIGARPLWDISPTAMSMEESDLLQWFDPPSTVKRPCWLASALLRRIGTFTASGLPARLTGWTTGGTQHDRWKFEFEFIPGHRRAHERVLNLLTHPEVGLPLRVTKDVCSCRSGHGHGCWATLQATSGHQGSVQLLFHDCDPGTVTSWESRWPAQFAQIRAGNSAKTADRAAADCGSPQENPS